MDSRSLICHILSALAAASCRRALTSSCPEKRCPAIDHQVNRLFAYHAMDGAQSDTIASYLGWWREAGVVDGVSNNTCDWFALPVPAPRSDPAPREVSQPIPSALDQRRTAPAAIASPPAPAANAPYPVSSAMPDSLAAFDTWLRDAADIPGLSWSARCLPSGPGDASVMLLSDVPDSEDIAEYRLFSGAAGRLLDAMLAAIGRSRANVRMASIALTRPLAGRIPPDEASRLAAIARHHVMLVRPQHLVLLGQQAHHLMGATYAPDVNHAVGRPMTIAIHHPRLMLDRPMLKRQAWELLKTLKEPS